MQAAAARLGAPLGHDFCAISLSDNLKPWSIIERPAAAPRAEGDFVIALYNPASRARPAGVVDAFDLLRRRRRRRRRSLSPARLDAPTSRSTLTTLGEADPRLADMATLVMIGSSETRFIARNGAPAWMVTPRSYGGRR